MITVTRLNGPAFALNPDHIERIEATPDTVIHLVDGTNYVVLETVEEIVAAHSRIARRGHRPFASHRTTHRRRAHVARHSRRRVGGVTMAEGEGEAEAPAEEKKGSKKKLILMIVGLLVVGYVVASMTVLKAPPLTPAQKAAKAAAAKTALEAKCALANGLTPPAPKADKADKTTTTTVAPEPPAGGPVLTIDSITINLADPGHNHFLKLGLGIQLPEGTAIDTVKIDNPGAPALNHVIQALQTKTVDDLGPNAMGPLQSKLGYEICTNPQLNYGGKITAIYFTDFVAQ